MTTKIFVDLIGWIGSICVITAYGFLTAHKFTSKSISYQLLNIIGSIFLIINTFFYSAYPSTFVNIVWLSIAFVGLLNIYKSSRNIKKL